MFRTCDGTDPNLIRKIWIKDGLISTNGHWEDIPCNCGKTFDDVYHVVIYPHERF